MNLISTSTAIGWAGLFNGFAGKNAKKISFIDLLPFPEEIKKEEPKVSSKTANLVKKLIKEKKLSPKVIGHLTPILDDIFAKEIAENKKSGLV